jgi:Tfp pilus assembly protein PilZ
MHFCTSGDISEGGIFVSAIQYFEEGNVVELSIPVREGKITVKAQVKYAQPGIGAGVMFIDLNDEQRAKIKEVVENIAKFH